MATHADAPPAPPPPGPPPPLPEAGVVDALAQLFEERLGGMMLVRLGLTELLERFKQEEHALATSLKTILQLRDEERNAYRAQLDSAHAYTRQLEAQLHEAQRLRSEALAATAPPPMAPLPSSQAAAASTASLAGPTAPPWSATDEGDTGALQAVAARLSGAVNGFSAAVESMSDVALAAGAAMSGRSSVSPDQERLQRSAAPGDGGSTRPTSGDGAAAAVSPPAGGYLARVEQLQQRLAKERSSLIPNRMVASSAVLASSSPFTTDAPT